MNSQPQTESPRLSVIIPCFNEERRILQTLAQFQHYLARQDISYEILAVDDGSTDTTAQIITDAFPEVHLIRYTPNRGKGHATKVGITAAKGECRLVSDADASTPIDELEKFWPRIDAGADVVIASRALPESNVEIRQPFYRQNMGRIYNFFLRLLGLTRFPDTQCGFKLFTAKSCAAIFARQRMDGFGADVECLYIAQKHGLTIAQVPVRWLNSPDTRVHALYDSLRMIREAIIIRVNAFRGRYD